MAEEKFESRDDVVIEGHQAKFNLAAVGAINGTYAGEFVFRCYLSPSQQVAANREYRQMLGENATLADNHITFIAFALTQLKYRIISAPPFWSATTSINGIAGDIVDEEIISTVLDAAIHAQMKYKNEINKRKVEMLEKAKAAAERILNGQAEVDEDEEFFEDEDEEELIKNATKGKKK